MRRAIGIVRVSSVAGREGESFASPSDQRERLRDACERDGLELIAVHEEIDVSGGTPLADRGGLSAAVGAVEAKEADVVMVAYFDRLVRSLRVQDEVVSRVEAAGGRVVAIDFGEVTGRTAAQWLSGTMIGAVSEYYRRSVRERVGGAQARAVARGVPPFARVPPGYVREKGGALEVGPDAPVIAEAFKMRAEGESFAAVRRFLRERGIRRSHSAVQQMLRSRIYLGELRFGELVNPSAHEPIVERDVWEGAQRTKPRGAGKPSDLLLARLGVLRCGTCGARLVAGVQTQRGKRYPYYRCSSTSDCERRVAVGAEIAERVVIEKVREALADVEGRAAAGADAREAEQAAEQAQADLDAAIRAFSGVEDEPAAVERLAELRRVRDEAQERAHRLGGLRSAEVVSVDDWDDLTLEGRRALIRAVVKRATVEPGRGPGRIRVELRGEP